MKSETLILRPGSGLCNRLRAIAGAMHLAKEAECRLEIQWFSCPLRRWAGLCGMRARFDDLFKPIESVRIKEKIKIRNDFPWEWMRWSSINVNYYGEDRRHNLVVDVRDKLRKQYWLYTCHEFYPAMEYCWLRPKTKLAARIDSVASRFGGHCIGFHIRRTDNKNAIAHSPLSLFTNKMDEEIIADSNVRFFLSTDDTSLKGELCGRYGDRLLTCHEVAPRYTVQGEEDAVVDLFLLSRTTKIYGSFWSSFSKVAAQIGNIPLEVLTAKDTELPIWAEN